mgnify:CR=1 FL=1
MIIEEMTIPANDLGRFVQAQDELFCDYGQALKEVHRCRRNYSIVLYR